MTGKTTERVLSEVVSRLRRFSAVSERVLRYAHCPVMVVH
jgi:nucleotide-binding universal stress UspA family protein